MNRRQQNSASNVYSLDDWPKRACGISKSRTVIGMHMGALQAIMGKQQPGNR
jgi:hypothetical protein